MLGGAAVGSFLLASATACLVTPDIGNESGTCSAGRTCTCDGIGNCGRDDYASGSQIDCRSAGTCSCPTGC